MNKLLLAGAAEHRLRQFAHGLAHYGYDCVQAATTAQVWQALLQHHPDVIVLDCRSTDRQMDPWRMARELVAVDHIPVIVLTRNASSRDRMRAFQNGVQHCLCAPVSPADVAAFIKAMFSARELARHHSHPPAQVAYADAQLRIDIGNLEVHRNGKIMPLSSREAALVESLLECAGQVIPSRDLCARVWGPSAWPQKRNALKTYISHLRRKIERDPKRPSYIVSRRGIGYAFMPGPAA